MLSNQTIAIIKSTVPALEEKGLDITKLFYKNLFIDYPELLNIFNQANQKKGRQQTALANTVLAAARHIDRLEAILPAVRQIAEKHRSLGVLPEHYPIVGEYLLKAIKSVLGEAATDEILGAWGEAYGVIADAFIQTEKDLYQKAEHKAGGWAGFKRFVVDAKVKESEIITSFYLKPEDGSVLPEFLPGQYVTIRMAVPGEEFLINRQYSLSAASGKETYRISVKKEKMPDTPEGRASNYLHNSVLPGSIVEMSVPAGTFVLEPGNRPAAFISGGVGITPLMAMLETIQKETPEREVTLVHSVRNGAVQPFRDEVKSYRSNMPNCQLAFVYSQPSETDLKDEDFRKQGYADIDLFRDLGIKPGMDVYVCGPVPFLNAVLPALKELGIQADDIHYEFFGPAVAMA